MAKKTPYIVKIFDCWLAGLTLLVIVNVIFAVLLFRQQDHAFLRVYNVYSRYCPPIVFQFLILCLGINYYINKALAANSYQVPDPCNMEKESFREIFSNPIFWALLSLSTIILNGIFYRAFVYTLYSIDFDLGIIDRTELSVWDYKLIGILDSTHLKNSIALIINQLRSLFYYLREYNEFIYQKLVEDLKWITIGKVNVLLCIPFFTSFQLSFIYSFNRRLYNFIIRTWFLSMIIAFNAAVLFIDEMGHLFHTIGTPGRLYYDKSDLGAILLSALFTYLLFSRAERKRRERPTSILPYQFSMIIFFFIQLLCWILNYRFLVLLNFIILLSFISLKRRVEKKNLKQGEEEKILFPINEFVGNIFCMPHLFLWIGEIYLLKKLFFLSAWSDSHVILAGIPFIQLYPAEVLLLFSLIIIIEHFRKFLFRYCKGRERSCKRVLFSQMLFVFIGTGVILTTPFPALIFFHFQGGEASILKKVFYFLPFIASLLFVLKIAFYNSKTKTFKSQILFK